MLKALLTTHRKLLVALLGAAGLVLGPDYLGHLGVTPNAEDIITNLTALAMILGVEGIANKDDT